MGTIELTSKIRELKKLQALIEEATAEAETIKDALKSEMDARGASELNVDVFKVRYTTVKSNRFDGTAFKATHKELYEQYTKPTETRRFTVA